MGWKRANRVNVFELPKFRPESDNISQLPPDQKWLYLFTHALEMESAQLCDLLGDAPYREAIGVLEMISKTPEDFQYYEDREKFLRDEQALLTDARDEGERIGMQKGEQIGMQKGEQIGLSKVELSKVRLLQELMGEAVSSEEQLLALDKGELSVMLAQLQDRLRKRMN